MSLEIEKLQQQQKSLTCSYAEAHLVLVHFSMKLYSLRFQLPDN